MYVLDEKVGYIKFSAMKKVQPPATHLTPGFEYKGIEVVAAWQNFRKKRIEKQKFRMEDSRSFLLSKSKLQSLQSLPDTLS